MNYTLEELIPTFKAHHEEAEKREAELNDKYPDRERCYDFSIAKALHHICKEIKEMKLYLQTYHGF